MREVHAHTQLSMVLIYNSKIRGIVLIQEPTLHTTSFYRNTGQDLALADIQMAKEQH